MISHFYEWAGFANDHLASGIVDFWSCPIGLFITGSISLCAGINIFHPGIDDNLFDRIWYSILSLLMLVAFLLGVNPHTSPRHIVQTLMYLLCIRFWATVIRKHYHWKKTGKAQKTIGM